MGKMIEMGARGTPDVQANPLESLKTLMTQAETQSMVLIARRIVSHLAAGPPRPAANKGHRLRRRGDDYDNRNLLALSAVWMLGWRHWPASGGHRRRQDHRRNNGLYENPRPLRRNKKEVAKKTDSMLLAALSETEKHKRQKRWPSFELAGSF